MPVTNAFSEYAWLAILLGLILWIILVIAEYRRYGWGMRVAGRSLLLFLAISALLFVVLKPGYQARGAGTTILLNGPGDQVLDSLLDEYPAATVLILGYDQQYQQLEGISYLSRYAPRGSTVFILGESLSEDEFHYLKDFKVYYLPGREREGVLSLFYQHQIGTADSLMVEGNWSAASRGSKLLLSLGGLALDSVVATQAGTFTYAVKAPAYFAGRQLYHLSLLNQRGDTLQAYRLPLQVHEPRNYQLALLTAFPEAESKYLKAFLGSQGYKLQYGAQLAPGKNIEEWINLPRKSFQYTQKSLAAWDAIIMSTSQYANLGSSRQQELFAVLQHAGTGLLLYPDGELNSLQWQGSRISFGQGEVKDTLLISGERVPLEYRPFRQLPDGWEVVLRGPKGIAAIGRRHGLGKLVVTAGVESYTLLLKGAEEAYTRYWNSLLEETLPLQDKINLWEPVLGAAVNSPLELQFQSMDSLPQARLLGPDQQPISVSFWQNTQHQQRWKTRFWPRSKGWHSAQLAEDTLQFWVGESLPGIVKVQRQERLQQYLKEQARMPLLERYEQKPLPLWLYYALFLTSMAALWLEKKING